MLLRPRSPMAETEDLKSFQCRFVKPYVVVSCVNHLAETIKIQDTF